jgi:hypothetical protein
MLFKVRELFDFSVGDVDGLHDLELIRQSCRFYDEFYFLYFSKRGACLQWAALALSTSTLSISA